ncbi:MAG: hypothetical protein EBZ13_11715 [Planctomycetia bacterium]|nr:hypothetical protein [Planctomycetia bacterium]
MASRRPLVRRDAVAVSTSGRQHHSRLFELKAVSGQGQGIDLSGCLGNLPLRAGTADGQAAVELTGQLDRARWWRPARNCHEPQQPVLPAIEAAGQSAVDRAATTVAGPAPAS